MENRIALNEDHDIEEYKGYELDFNTDTFNKEDEIVEIKINILKNGKVVHQEKGLRNARKWVDNKIEQERKSFDIKFIDDDTWHDFDSEEDGILGVWSDINFEINNKEIDKKLKDDAKGYDIFCQVYEWNHDDDTINRMVRLMGVGTEPEIYMPKQKSVEWFTSLTDENPKLTEKGKREIKEILKDIILEYVYGEKLNESLLTEDHKVEEYKGYELDFNTDLLDTEEESVVINVRVIDKNGKVLTTQRGFRKAREFVDKLVAEEEKRKAEEEKRLQNFNVELESKDFNKGISKFSKNETFADIDVNINNKEIEKEIARYVAGNDILDNEPWFQVDLVFGEDKENNKYNCSIDFGVYFDGERVDTTIDKKSVYKYDNKEESEFIEDFDSDNPKWKPGAKERIEKLVKDFIKKEILKTPIVKEEKMEENLYIHTDKEDNKTIKENECDYIALTEYEGGEPVKFTKSDKDLEAWLDADGEHSWFPVTEDTDDEMEETEEEFEEELKDNAKVDDKFSLRYDFEFEPVEECESCEEEIKNKLELEDFFERLEREETAVITKPEKEQVREEKCKENKKLKEELGAFAGEEFCEEIADRLEDGYWSGYTNNDTSWELTVNGMPRSEFSPSFADYLAEEISYPVRDGHLRYMGIQMHLYKSNLESYFGYDNIERKIPDLIKLGLDREDIDEWLRDTDPDALLDFYCDYDIEFDVDEWEEKNAEDIETEEDEDDEELEESKVQIKESLTEEDYKEIEEELADLLERKPKEGSFEIEDEEVKEYIKKRLQEKKYKVEISGNDLNKTYHIEYYRANEIKEELEEKEFTVTGKTKDFKYGANIKVRVKAKDEEDAKRKFQEKETKVEILGVHETTPDEIRKGVQELKEEVDVTEWRSNTLEFPNGEVLYVDYKDGKLIAGGITNAGVIPEFEVEYDEDFDENWNLDVLYNVILKLRPELNEYKINEEIEEKEDYKFKLGGVNYYVKLYPDNAGYIAKWWDDSDNGLGYNNKGFVNLDKTISELKDNKEKDIREFISVISEYDRTLPRYIKNKIINKVVELKQLDR